MKRRLLEFVFVATVVLLIVTSNSRGCGIDWDIPRNHFDGVNEWGQLAYWHQAGEIDVGDGLKLPLILGFNPTRKASAYLGKGWIVPLLESNIVQIDERRFVVTQPDGTIRRFGRRSPNDAILVGEGGWKGQINDNTITLWASCGWRLTFNQGKINSISTPKGRLLSYRYVNGEAVEILFNGHVILSIDRGQDRNFVIFKYGNNLQATAELGEKPDVQVIDGQNVIGKIDRSLHRLTMANGVVDTYTFSVDDKLLPILKISGENLREFTWNPANGRLLKDGDWEYDITGGEEFVSNANITRVNSQGRNESWFLDRASGREVLQFGDGSKIVKNRFVSGPLQGNLRKQETFFNEKSESQIKYSYDGNGNLLRSVESGHLIPRDSPSLKEAEQKLLASIAGTKNEHDQNTFRKRLALFFLYKRRDIINARRVAGTISDVIVRSNVMTHIIYRDPEYPPEQKLAAIQALPVTNLTSEIMTKMEKDKADEK
jgi:hypothetical protein